MPIIDRNDPRSLNEVLESLGLTTKPARGMYQKHIVRAGEIVFTGNAHAVWEWINRGMTQ